MTVQTLDVDERKKTREEIAYAPGSETDLEELSALVRGMRPYSPDRVRLRSFSRDYYHWIYFLNPSGPAVVYIARHRGVLVGSMAVAPKRFQLNDREIRVGKTMEIFTHPAYQGMGIMKELSRRVFEATRAGGIDCWYVTPSKNSYPIFLNRWGYREVFENYYLMQPFKPSRLLGVAAGSPSLGRWLGWPFDLVVRAGWFFYAPPSAYELREEEGFGPETDALWERSKGTGLALVRDARYLSWRYVDHPDPYIILKCYRNQDLAGLVVLKHTLRRGLKAGEIVDLLFPPEDLETLRALLRFGLRRLYEDGCVFAQAWAIRSSVLEREMKQAGLFFRRTKLPVLLSPEAPHPEFYEGRAWFLTQGDGNDI